MIGIIDSCVAYAKQLCYRVSWRHGNIIQRPDFRPLAGLKATSSVRSLKSRICGDFTRKISKNGHFWGLAKMARALSSKDPPPYCGGFTSNLANMPTIRPDFSHPPGAVPNFLFRYWRQYLA
jgi:hypothetical protein